MELKAHNLLNSFNDNYAEQFNLDEKTQLLYFKLVYIWNKARRPEVFYVDNKRLMELARINSDSSLISRRKILIKLNLIKYTPSKKRGQASSYSLLKNYHDNFASTTTSTNASVTASTITSTTASKNKTLEANNDKGLRTHHDNFASTNASPITSPITSTNASENASHNKSNRDIENNIYIYNNARDNNISPAESQVLIFYQNRICSNLGGTPGANEIACLREYAQVYGAEQTIQALKKALQSSRKLQGIYFVKYVGGILIGWANLKIAGGESNGQLQSSNLSRTATQAQRKTGTDINWAELD